MTLHRRSFLTLLGGAAATWPMAARGQQAERMPVIGFLNPTSPEVFAPHLAAFHKGLGEAGYVEGQNVTIEYRWAEEQYNRLPALAADLVLRRVTVIAATGGAPSPLAAKAATSTIPIVFNSATDPVNIGLVSSINRPGGNVTGVSTLNGELMPKRLEMLCEVAFGATLIGLLVNPNAVTGNVITDVETAARSLKRQIMVLNASNDHEIDAAFAAAVQQRAGALLINTNAFFNSRSEKMGALSLRHAMPAIYQLREFAGAGGLMSYGVSLTDTLRQVGVYTGRILNGEKPADLPVVQSSKFELVINLRAAKTLGLTVPLPLLARADEVIE